MRRFLLDAEPPRHHAPSLAETYGCDAVDLNSPGLGQLPDRSVIELATAEGRLIVTEDQRVGEHCGQDYRGRAGVILLRHRVQSANAANGSPARLFDDPE